MKAEEQPFKSLIEGSKQFVVPLFQRSYSWSKKEWETLWDDLYDLYNDKSDANPHFFGSIVLIPIETDLKLRDVTRYQLIDGQQRLTTIFVLLTLIRCLAAKEGALFNQVHRIMLNSSLDDNDEHFKSAGGHLKLLPTQIDRAVFKCLLEAQNCIDTNTADNKNTGMRQCYDFFMAKLKKFTIAAKSDSALSNLYRVIINRLHVVTITLNTTDNPYLIFEGLNAKGQALTQADLIRNYIFMQILEEEQDAIYARYWEPMQRDLDSKLTECMRHYLMRNGIAVKKNNVYSIMKFDIAKRGVKDILLDMSVFAGYYKKLLVPTQENDSFICAALTRINELDVATSYPFLLNCYHAYAQDSISSVDMVSILQTIENFIVRRYICDVSANSLDKIFSVLYKQLGNFSGVNFLEKLCSVLQNHKYPNDDTFRECLQEFPFQVDKPHKIKAKAKLIQNTVDAKRKQLKLKHTAYNNKVYIDLALEIWPYFGTDQVTITDMTGTKPSTITFFNQEFAVSSWRDVLITTLTNIADLQAESFSSLAEQYPNFISAKMTNKHNHQLANGFYIVTVLSANDIRNFCNKAIEIMNELSGTNEILEITLTDSNNTQHTVRG